MKRRSKEKGQEKNQENMSSRLLSPQENERVEDLLGRRCVVSTEHSLSWGELGSGGHDLLHVTVKNRVSCSECIMTVDLR